MIIICLHGPFRVGTKPAIRIFETKARKPVSFDALESKVWT